jgi:hypothetical protein
MVLQLSLLVYFLCIGGIGSQLNTVLKNYFLEVFISSYSVLDTRLSIKFRSAALLLSVGALPTIAFLYRYPYLNLCRNHDLDLVY